MITNSDAVASLRPNVEWTMTGDDVEGIIWHTPDVEQLTVAEVEAEITRLEAEAVARVEAEQAARAAAITHAKSLGFTDEMIAVMYPNLGSEA
jgi:uncharacterized small protein (DUF1192 family)